MPEIPLIDIRPDQWEIVRGILQKHVPQYDVWAFGSRAKWTAKPYSDLDLAVICDQPLSLGISAALADDFSDSDLPWKVDVTDWATTSEAFRTIIARDKVAVKCAAATAVTEWQRVPLNSLIDPDRGISYGIVQPGARVNHGIPVIRVADIRNGQIATQSPLLVSAEVESAYLRSRLRGGELLLTFVGTVGETAVVPPELSGLNVARAVAVIPVRSEIGAYWIKASLRTSEVKERMLARLNTTVQATLNLKDVSQLPIPLPPQVDRDCITHILRSLDDKIELNRRSSETLEAMARAVFKDWFIDFGPVRAKLNGLPPYLAPDIWALFPDEGDEDGIPKGWGLGTLKELTTKIGSGSTPRGGKEVYVDEGVALIRSQNVYDSEFVWPGLARITDQAAKQLSNVEVMRDDVLLNITGASILRTCVVEPGALPARVNQHVAIIRAKDGIPCRFLHLHLLQKATKDYLMGLNAGASREAVTKAHIESVPILNPGAALLGAFETAVAPIYAEVEALVEESRSLAQLRDILLPKLISGELRISNPREFLEEATA